MVWPFPLSSSPSTPQSSQDAQSKLDPSLQAFLQQEKPVDYKPTPAPKPSAPATSHFPTLSSSDPASSSSSETSAPSDPSAPQARPPSLFKDGRYDHLWQTYTAQSALDAGKPQQEKLEDIVSLHRARQSSLGAVAMENCALEALAQDECYRNPGWGWDRLSMCQAKTRGLDRCLAMNKRFLKALGYVGLGERDKAEEERIQMHADMLFRRMLAREKEEEDARVEGRKLGVRRGVLEEFQEEKGWRLEEVPGKRREELRGRLDRFPEGSLEREMEERAVLNEIETARVAGKQYKEIQAADLKAREERRVQGNSTVGDMFLRFAGK